MHALGALIAAVAAIGFGVSLDRSDWLVAAICFVVFVITVNELRQGDQS